MFYYSVIRMFVIVVLILKPVFKNKKFTATFTLTSPAVMVGKVIRIWV